MAISREQWSAFREPMLNGRSWFMPAFWKLSIDSTLHITINVKHTLTHTYCAIKHFVCIYSKYLSGIHSQMPASNRTVVSRYLLHMLRSISIPIRSRHQLTHKLNWKLETAEKNAVGWNCLFSDYFELTSISWYSNLWLLLLVIREIDFNQEKIG